MFHVQQLTKNAVFLPALNLPHGSSKIDVLELHREYLGQALTLQALGGGGGSELQKGAGHYHET